jgi:hypothetical protein
LCGSGIEAQLVKTDAREIGPYHKIAGETACLEFPTGQARRTVLPAAPSLRLRISNR